MKRLHQHKNNSKNSRQFKTMLTDHIKTFKHDIELSLSRLYYVLKKND